MINNEIAKRLAANSDFGVMKAHMESCISELDKCSTIAIDDDYDKESRGRARAVEILRTILAPFSKIEDDIVLDKREHALKKHALEG